MTDIARLPRTSVVRHHPELMRREEAKIDALIGYAKKVKDWSLLEQAIDAKIEQQQEFVAWWVENVSIGHGGDRSKISDRRSWSRIDAERLTGIQDGQVSRWKKRLQDPVRYHERILAANRRATELTAAANHRAEGTGENEWFTPAQYIEAARTVLEVIDLDPASHPTAQEWIKANRFFTRADNGLERSWLGRIWLNPPYARGEIAAFIDKLIREIESGRVTAAVLLTHSYTDTEWFHNVASVMQAMCFTKGRVKFVDDAGETCSPTQGQVFFYYGPDIEEFEKIFRVFGLVIPTPVNVAA